MTKKRHHIKISADKANNNLKMFILAVCIIFVGWIIQNLQWLNCCIFTQWNYIEKLKSRNQCFMY